MKLLFFATDYRPLLGGIATYTEELALKTITELIRHRKDLNTLKIHISKKYEPTQLVECR